MGIPVEGFTEIACLGTGPVSVETCISRQFFEKEIEKVFKRSWFNLIQREEEIPNPGDYFVRDIEILNAQIIVVRGRDNKIRGFHNVCTHRGNRVAYTSKGKSNGFQCNFHGWVFSPEGDLAFVVDEEQFFNLNKKCLGLKPVHIESWAGFLFANFEEKPSQTLEDSMGDFNTDLKPFPFHEMTCAGHYRYRVKANWKTTMNAFQEGYHVPFVHKRSAPEAFNNLGGCHIQKIKLQANGNQSIAVPANPQHKLSPTEEIAFQYGATFTQGVGSRQTYPGTNKGKVENWGFDLNIIFPFSRINVGAGWYYADAFWPIDLEETVYELAYYFPRPKNAGEMISQEFSKIILRDLSREDLSTNEACQQAIKSGAIKEYILSDQEAAVRHLYATVEKIVNT